MRRIVALLSAAGCSGILSAAAAAPAAAAPYPYRSPAFTLFVEDSYRVAGTGKAGDFYAWFEGAYARCAARNPGRESLSLTALLDDESKRLGAIRGETRAREERAFAEWMHRMVKTVIPRFSLDRGFEFTNTVRYGERQCYLQAVLIAGMLQRAGVDAGIVMVYRNIEGHTSNNGHAATLAHFTGGRCAIVDASDPIPLVRQTGLMAAGPRGYLYVEPQYVGATPLIRAFRTTGSHQALTTAQVRSLDNGFVRSQFYYYRGERVPGGLLGGGRNRPALEQARAYLTQAVRYCPQNPLAVYMLGRAELSLGASTAADRRFQQARALYLAFGWLPEGPSNYAARKVPGRPKGGA